MLYCGAPHGWTQRHAHTTRLRAAAFVEAMGARGVLVASRVTAAVLDHWRAERMTRVSRATINRDETTARVFLNWCVARGLCPAPPHGTRAKVREPRRSSPRTIPSPADVGRVVHQLERAGQRGAALVLAAGLATGLRLDELRHLRPEHVDRDAVRVVPEAGPAEGSWTTKGYRERRVPVQPAVAALLAELAAWLTGGAGGRGKAPGLGGTWLAQQIDAACEIAGVTPFRAHDLRRTFATESVRAGVPITVVQGWLGHRDLQTTERYLGRYASDAAERAPVPAALAVYTTLVHSRGENLSDSEEG